MGSVPRAREDSVYRKHVEGLGVETFLNGESDVQPGEFDGRSNVLDKVFAQL